MADEHESLLEHMPLEEVRIERIVGYEPPDDSGFQGPGGEGEGSETGDEPQLPPVLIERSDGSGYSLLVHHRTVWSARMQGKLALRALVVRSSVHIPVAHGTVGNCLEEALLFEGLLEEGLVENRSRLADMLGYSRARITQVLNLLKLPEEMKRQLLTADGVSEFQLRPLVRISDPRAQGEAFRKLVADNLTGRQMEKYLSEKKGRAAAAARTGSGAAERRPSSTRAKVVQDIEELMEKELTESVESVAETDSREAAARSTTGDPADSGTPASRPASAIRAGRLRDVIRRLGPSLREGNWEEEAALEGFQERDMLFLRGVGLMQRGLYERATEILNEVTVASPEHALAYYFLGRCSNLLGRTEAAESYFRTAIDLMPSDPDMITDLAIVLEKQKRYDEATSCYRKARRLRKAAAAEKE
jgi:tetratricopeptide (TPR) repeat protein